MELCYTCIALGCLPNEGGLLGQDFIHVLALRYVKECEPDLIEKRKRDAEHKRPAKRLGRGRLRGR